MPGEASQGFSAQTEVTPSRLEDLLIEICCFIFLNFAIHLRDVYTFRKFRSKFDFKRHCGTRIVGNRFGYFYNQDVHEAAIRRLFIKWNL